MLLDLINSASQAFVTHVLLRLPLHHLGALQYVPCSAWLI